MLFSVVMLPWNVLLMFSLHAHTQITVQKCHPLHLPDFSVIFFFNLSSDFLNPYEFTSTMRHRSMHFVVSQVSVFCCAKSHFLQLDLNPLPLCFICHFAWEMPVNDHSFSTFSRPFLHGLVYENLSQSKYISTQESKNQSVRWPENLASSLQNNDHFLRIFVLLSLSVEEENLSWNTCKLKKSRLRLFWWYIIYCVR